MDGRTRRMDGQIEACHGRGHIFLHFRCEIARSVRWSWVGGERILEDGADPTSPSLTAPHFLFRLLCFPVICSQPPTAAPAPAPARPRFFVFRKVFVPRSGVASSRRTEQGNRWGERRTSFRRSAGERLFRDRRSDEASERAGETCRLDGGVINFLHKSAVSALSRVECL